MLVKSARGILVLVILAALGVRLGWALTRPADNAAIDQLPDQREYLETARNYLAGEGLSFTDPRFVQRVQAFRTPGYPLFLAACRGNVRAARVAQAVIDTGTVLAAYLLAVRWLSPATGLLAALFVAFNPFLIYFSGLLLTETLFTALLAWGMVLLVSRSTWAWLAGGMALALSVLVRPGAIAMPVMLGVLAAIANRADGPAYHRKWPLPVGTTMLLLTIAALLPWASRNHRVVGRWIWTSTNEGITRYDGFNPDATGASDQAFVAAMPQLRRMSETERDRYLAEQAQQFIRENPRRAIELAGEKILRTWSPRPMSSEFSRPLYVAAALAFSLPFDLLVILGLLRPTGLRKSAKLFLLSPAVYLTVAAAASVGSLRYRIPAEVPMSVLSAAGATSLVSLLSSRSRVSEPIHSTTDVPADVP
jgi:4-amino-4-deoxy-L-arabinose transferase-like glycosyltransferase